MSINISDFIDTEVKEFSKYVLYSRAIPSVVDGLKPSQRKILWTAIKTTSAKNIKTASLSGNVISCLVGNTKIDTTNGESITIEDFYNNRHTNSAVDVDCIDDFGAQQIGRGYNPILSKYVYKTLHITLTNGLFVECTPEHLIAVDDGSIFPIWKKSENLISGKDKVVYVMDDVSCKYSTIKDILVCHHSEPVPVYDITVNRYHNFSVNGGIIVHNCANYHHGDASLNDAISSMAQTFKNNNTLIDGEGSFGSRAIPIAAAARYTFVRLSNNFKKYFTDTEIAPLAVDLEDPEPQYYLPIIPWVLVNGIRGIAVGFATEIQPRSIKDIKKTCVDYMSGKNIDNRKIKPCYPHFTGTFELNDKGVWECSGKFELKGKKLTITEIPIGYDREQYIKVLDALIDNKDIIRYKETKSTTKGFRFEVALRNSKSVTDLSIIKMFKLKKSMNENITVIDENGNLKIFENEIQLIKHFCDFRLKQYPTRYKRKIDDAKNSIHFKKEKIRFIESVNRKKINMKVSLKIVRKALKMSGYDDEIAQKLVNMPIFHLSQDKLDELGFEISDLENNIDIWSNINCKTQFRLELKEL